MDQSTFIGNQPSLPVLTATAAVWASKNPVLQKGELGFESDTLKFKIGDGLTAFSSLSYAGGSSSGGASEMTLGDASGTWTDGVTVLRITSGMSANRAINLPTAASFSAGSRIVCIDRQTTASSAFIRTFNVQGSDTVNGSSSYAPFAGPGTYEFESDGVNGWQAVHDSSTVITFRDTTDPAKQGHLILSNVTSGQDRGMRWPDTANWTPLVIENVKTSQGSTTTGTAGTAVAEVLADSGMKFVNWELVAKQASAASTQIKVIVTYSDSTNDNQTTSANAASGLVGNKSGIVDVAAGSGLFITPQAKSVTGLRIETAGTGTGIRCGCIHAYQVPI